MDMGYQTPIYKTIENKGGCIFVVGNGNLELKVILPLKLISVVSLLPLQQF
jgi:hypothetical protein